MNPRKVYVLYEHGADMQPYSCSEIRLLRPLTHPSLGAHLQVSWGLEYGSQEADIVIVDRLWRPDISPCLAQDLLSKVRRTGARFIYAIDDNLLDMRTEKKDWQPTEDQIGTVEYFLRQADCVLVTTPPLRDRFLEYNPHIAVLPNALDERLLSAGPSPDQAASVGIRNAVARVKNLVRSSGRFGRAKNANAKLIGYMGTFTHDDDLLMILPALRKVFRRHRDGVGLQILGVVGHQQTVQALQGLPVTYLHPGAETVRYASFLPWFIRNVRWDVALAPLRDTAFNACKSDVKFLDYSALGAAGIYSRMPAYASVQHQETGWLAENGTEAWEEALERLLAHGALRDHIAHNATQYLYAERTLAHRAHQWLDALDSLPSHP